MMNRKDEIEREVEDCCEYCAFWWDNSTGGCSCHCERSPKFGKHTYRHEVCGHFETVEQYYEE